MATQLDPQLDPHPDQTNAPVVPDTPQVSVTVPPMDPVNTNPDTKDPAVKDPDNRSVLEAADVGDSSTLADGATPSAPVIAANLNASVVRKYDLRILPLIFLSWVVFYLDRAAIALARVNGMEEDLGLAGNQFNIALMLFFFPYILFNIPGNLVLRKVGGGRLLPFAIVAWGLVTTFTGFVNSYASLCVTRIFLGLTESAFLGVVMLYLGFFYTEFELVARTGLFYSGNALAGTFGGFLATGLSKIHFRGYDGWPWIFFIEGVITVVLGTVAFFILPNTPQTASFLTPAERAVAVERTLALDRRHEVSFANAADFEKAIRPDSAQEQDKAPTTTATGAVSGDRLKWSTVKRALWNPVAVMMGLATFACIEALYSFTLFLPTIILAMGHKGTNLNLLTVPPNFVAFIAAILVTQYSQRSGKKAIPMLVCAVVATIGYLFLLIGSRVGVSSTPAQLGFGNPRAATSVDRTGFVVQYVGTFFVAVGINTIPPIALAWTCINASPHYVRAIVLGFITTFGNTAAFLASFTYVKTEFPRYTTGHSINLGCCVALTAIAVALILYMRAENKKRERGGRDYRLETDPSLSGEDKALFELELGWMHPRHRFQL